MSNTHDHLPDINLRQLRTFVVLARLGSFSQAGAEIGLSQSGVSRQIRALEASVGLQLFERLGRRAVLTPAGKLLQERLSTILREAETLPRLLRDLAEGVQGQLRIGACITAANALLPPLLAMYREKYPRVELALHPGSSSRTLERLHAGELDLALVASEIVSPGFTILGEIPDELVLVGAAAHPLCGRRRKPAELAGCDFVQRESTSDTRALVTRWFQRERIQVRNLMDVW